MVGGKITYRLKNETQCPICKAKFYREELHKGGGRMNAGELTDELHRKYLPTQKFGEIYPLVYPIIVCPNCWFATLPRHIDDLNEDTIKLVLQNTPVRKSLVNSVFNNLDFEKDRTLAEGIAAYLLAAACYEHFPQDALPTFYCGLCFLRAGWLAGYLHEKERNEHYDYMARIMLRKAAFYYGETVRKHESGDEEIDVGIHYGPDMDNNYGFDGIFYLASILQFRYGQTDNKENRYKMLHFARLSVSRFVGFGKSSRDKPSPFLELGRKLHKKISVEYKQLRNELQVTDNVL